MRKLKEVLRLKFEAKLSHRAIARSLKISANSVSTYTRAAQAAGISWPLSEPMSESELLKWLRPYHDNLPIKRRRTPPAYGRLHQELKRKGVTLEL